MFKVRLPFPSRVMAESLALGIILLPHRPCSQSKTADPRLPCLLPQRSVESPGHPPLAALTASPMPSTSRSPLLRLLVPIYNGHPNVMPYVSPLLFLPLLGLEIQVLLVTVITDPQAAHLHFWVLFCFTVLLSTSVSKFILSASFIQALDPSNTLASSFL